MEVVVGKLSGFCFGVNNAVNKTEELLKSGKNIYCLGELVHNKQVIDKLKSEGIKFIEKVEEAVHGCELIIRAHGVAPQVYQKAKEKNINLFDFTCPKVAKLHEQVNEAKKENYIFLIGEKNHPEIIGTKGFAGDNISIIQDEEDIDMAIKQLKKSNMKKLYIVAQTTASVQKFNQFTEKILNDVEDVDIEINKSICDSTRLRQEETERLAKKVDLMIIIGGKNSSNTTKLYNIAKENCDSIHIQTKEDLKLDELKKYSKIGITAGASTPKEIIKDVEEEIKKIK